MASWKPKPLAIWSGSFALGRLGNGEKDFILTIRSVTKEFLRKEGVSDRSEVEEASALLPAQRFPCGPANQNITTNAHRKKPQMPAARNKHFTLATKVSPSSQNWGYSDRSSTQPAVKFDAGVVGLMTRPNGLLPIVAAESDFPIPRAPPLQSLLQPVHHNQQSQVNNLPK